MLDKLREMFRPVERLTPEQYLAKLTEYGLHPDGTPVLDPTPMAPPIGYKRTPSMVEIVRDMVRSERLRAEAEAGGFETFEEADDFDVPDDPDPMPQSLYENDFDPPVEELLRAGREALAEKAKKAAQDESGGVGAGAPTPVPEPAPAPASGPSEP